MKVYYLFGLFLLSAVSCRNIGDETNKIDDSSEEILPLDPTSIAVLQAKCKEVGGEVAVKKLNLAFDKSTACFNNEVPKTDSEFKMQLGDNSEYSELCSTKRKSLRTCFVDIIEAIKDCSLEEEKYAPDFLFDAIDSFSEFVCADNAKLVQDIVNANETSECFGYMMDIIFAGNITYICTDNFKLLHRKGNSIITKQALCADLVSAKMCYSAFLVRECPYATALNGFLVGTFDAISSPCKDVPVENKPGVSSI